MYCREFLTGFHKRKLAKKEESKKKAQAREKEERLETRQEVCASCSLLRFLSSWADITRLRFSIGECSQSRPPRTPQESKRRTVASRNVRVRFPSLSFVRFLPKLTHGGQGVESADGEWTGIASSPSPGAGLDHPEHEYEYSDEEQLATVTVVEDFDPSAFLHGEPSSSVSEDEQRPKEEERPPLPRARAKVATRGHSSADVGGERPANEGKKNKDKNGAAKKVRYETKAARRATRATQRARRTEKAERAGGKAARKKTGGRRPRG
jgi:ribosomal RNA-processing protein 17